MAPNGTMSDDSPGRRDDDQRDRLGGKHPVGTGPAAGTPPNDEPEAAPRGPGSASADVGMTSDGRHPDDPSNAGGRSARQR